MTFRKFMELYDNWNGIVKVNDNDLNCIVKCNTADLMFKDGRLYDPKLMRKQVVAFGFFGNTITVRVK